ncbi:hypothetical protein B0H13DRAFT_1884033 [Mycena leptocephala]|nr:hypothetical protein B0H13DRAFT_1884033 [Mycena leptocephala]
MASRALKSPDLDPLRASISRLFRLADHVSLAQIQASRPRLDDWVIYGDVGVPRTSFYSFILLSLTSTPSRPPGVGRWEAVTGSALPVIVRESSALRGAQRSRVEVEGGSMRSKCVGAALVLQRRRGGLEGAGTPTNQTLFPIPSV